MSNYPRTPTAEEEERNAAAFQRWLDQNAEAQRLMLEHWEKERRRQALLALPLWHINLTAIKARFEEWRAKRCRRYPRIAAWKWRAGEWVLAVRLRLARRIAGEYYRD